MLKAVIISCCLLVALASGFGLYDQLNRLGTSPTAASAGVNGTILALSLPLGSALVQLIRTLRGRIRPSIMGSLLAFSVLGCFSNYYVNSVHAAELATHAYRTKGVIARIREDGTETTTYYTALVHYRVEHQVYQTTFEFPTHELARYHPNDSCVVYYSNQRPGISKAGPDTAGVRRDIRHF